MVKGQKSEVNKNQFNSSANREQQDAARRENNSARFAELSKPQLVLGFESGIEFTARDSVYIVSNEHVVLTSQQDTSVVAGERLSVSTKSEVRLFSRVEGIKLFAGKDDMEVQVQDGMLIEICLRTGGSEVKINSEGVFVTTPGVFKVKAATHNWVEPGVLHSNVEENFSVHLYLSTK